MADRTPLPSQEIPGWYIKFQSDVLQQLPRPEDGMDKITALRWDRNQRALKQNLSSLVTPPKTNLSDGRLGIIHTFDIFVPDNIDELVKKQSGGTARIIPDLKIGQKIKVDIMMNGWGISTRNCINYLKGEDALLLGELGAMLVLKQALKEPLGCTWTASFSEENAPGLSHKKDYLVPGIIGPAYTNYAYKPRMLVDLEKEGLSFFFAFHDAS
ncbi:MAG: hypothetical protein A2481_01850 [Candidatus Yonathbacteria bacterium RIFOXYC2_FULL_47_9]|nr:MAG: hypothetical protein A2481_01850 [Candidatus Yonathbacteria bacterium RIFOXYC2_FULL_47_9]HAT68499.1 hypothetical protein [Candidatus Yonathbacteria bacterium]